MKLIGMSCAMVGLALAGCQKPVAQMENSSAPNLTASAQEVSPVAPHAISPAATQTTPPAAVPFVAERAPLPPREYAPSGVFYLLTAVRKDTRDGVIRLLPGTEVKLGRNGKYLTPEGEMTLDPKNLTNDMAVARAVHNADQAAQNAAYPKGLASAPAGASVAGSSPAAPSPTAAPLSAMNSLFSSAPTRTPAQQAEADTQVRAMKFKLSTLKSEEAKLQANVDYLHEKALSLPRTTGAPTGLSGSTNLADWNLINNKLAAVRAEIQSLESKLATSN